MHRNLIALFTLHFAVSAWPADLPCTAAVTQLRGMLTDPLNQPTPQFFACIRTNRVCIQSMSDGHVWAADSIRDLPAEGEASLGVVQTASSDTPKLCLIGIFSGGSAASWLFDGWKIVNGKPLGLSGMDKAQLNSDAVYPRGLGNEIYRAYAKFAK